MLVCYPLTLSMSPRSGGRQSPEAAAARVLGVEDDARAVGVRLDLLAVDGRLDDLAVLVLLALRAVEVGR